MKCTTCHRAAGFLYSATVDPPNISPLPDGSIDLHWKRQGAFIAIR